MSAARLVRKLQRYRRECGRARSIFRRVQGVAYRQRISAAYRTSRDDFEAKMVDSAKRSMARKIGEVLLDRGIISVRQHEVPSQHIFDRRDLEIEVSLAALDEDARIDVDAILQGEL